jgi:hypothetical protein
MLQLVAQHVVVGQPLGHGVHRLALAGDSDEDVDHLPLQHQAVVKDGVGFGQPDDVRARGLVQVGIDALAHDPGDVGLLARDLAHDVGDHAGRGGDLVGARRPGGRRLGPLASEQRENRCDDRQTDQCSHRSSLHRRDSHPRVRAAPRWSGPA